VATNKNPEENLKSFAERSKARIGTITPIALPLINILNQRIH
jgi:hypothetical protein